MRKKRPGSKEDLLPRKKKRSNSLLWLFEPLESDAGFICQKFFSFDSAYLDGRLYLGLVEGEEPWNGMLVCTSQEHHPSLMEAFPQLTPHVRLGKWLYLSQTNPEFEATAVALVELTGRRDHRVGVETGTKKPRKRKHAG